MEENKSPSISQKDIEQSNINSPRHFVVVNNSELLLESRGKKRAKKKAPAARKTKPSPVMKVDEETLGNCVSDNGAEEFEQQDISGENISLPGDEGLLLHLVLSRILDRKKMVGCGINKHFYLYYVHNHITVLTCMYTYCFSNCYYVMK